MFVWSRTVGYDELVLRQLVGVFVNLARRDHARAFDVPGLVGCVAAHVYDGDNNIITDNDALVALAGKDKHVTSLIGRACTLLKIPPPQLQGSGYAESQTSKRRRAGDDCNTAPVAKDRSPSSSLAPPDAFQAVLHGMIVTSHNLPPKLRG